MSKTTRIKTAAKAAARKMGAALSGQPGILDTLAAEHGEVDALLGELTDHADQPMAERAELYAQLRRTLLLHAAAEELVFYPACREHPETRVLAAEAEDDHDQIEALIAELDGMAMDAPAWLETLEALRIVVDDHVEQEETHLFARSKDALGSEQLRDLDDLYRERKRVLERDYRASRPVSPTTDTILPPF